MPLLIVTLVVMMTGVAGATVYEIQPAYELINDGDVAPADSDFIPVIGFNLNSTDGEILESVSFTIEDTGTGVKNSDFVEVALFNSTDTTFSGDDQKIGNTGSSGISIGSPTNIGSNTEIISDRSEMRYFIAIKTNSSWSDSDPADSIKVSVASGTSTYFISIDNVEATALTGTNVLTADTTPPDVDLSYNLTRPVKDSDTLNITADFNESIDTNPSISIDTTGDDLSSASMSGSGEIWYYEYDVPADSNGIATVTIDAVDPAGNSNNVATNNIFKIDNEVPALTLDTIVDGNEFADNTVWINGTFSDDISNISNNTLVITVNDTSYDYTDIGGASNISSSAYNFSLSLGDADHTVNVSVSDEAGNTNTTDTIDFSTDTEGPVIELDSISEGQNLTDSIVWINGTYSDNVVGVDNSTLVISVNNTETSFDSMLNDTGTFNYSLSLPDGDHNVTIDVDDNVGNAATQVLANFTVDATKPTLTLDTIVEGDEFNYSTVWINGTFSDGITGINNSTLEILVNGSTIDSSVSEEGIYNASITLPDDEHNVTVSIDDYAGNTKTTDTIDFSTDTEGPVIELDSISEGQNLTDSIVWINGTYSDNVVGVDNSTLVISVNNTETSFDSMLNDTGTFNYSLSLPDGDHNVTIDVDDNVGNAATQVLANFTVDATKPTLTLDTIVEGDEFNYSTVWINGTFSDGITGINNSTLEILVNGSTIDSSVSEEGIYNASITLPDDEHNVTVSIDDYAGNTNTTSLVNFSTDTTAPDAITGVTVEDIKNTDESLTVSWDASDASDFGNYNIYISTEKITDVSEMTPEATVADNTTTQTSLTTIGGISIEDGVDYYVAVAANDTLGNQNNTVTDAGPVKSFADMDLELDEGWNLVSTPVRLNNSSTEDVFGDRYVFYYDATEANWIYPENIEPCRGYWVFSESSGIDSVNLKFEYMPVDDSVSKAPPTQSLAEGWNMIGHTSTSEMPVIFALESLEDISYETGFSYYAYSPQESISVTPYYSNLLMYSDGRWDRYANFEFFNFNDFEYMNPGDGYWIFMKENKTYAAIDNYYREEQNIN
ncbi:beta strand repeat-containing protein [Methanohalophilus portucalensis]|nr:Ig-like domain-containing protein [Methanohalophilus portucalensis]